MTSVALAVLECHRPVAAVAAKQSHSGENRRVVNLGLEQYVTSSARFSSAEIRDDCAQEPTSRLPGCHP
jgi:hypothetical protein